MVFNKLTANGELKRIEGELHFEVIGEGEEYIIAMVIDCQGEDTTIISLDAIDYREFRNDLLLANSDVVKGIKKFRSLQKAARKEFVE